MAQRSQCTLLLFLLLCVICYQQATAFSLKHFASVHRLGDRGLEGSERKLLQGVDAEADNGHDEDYLIPIHGWFMTVAFAGIFPAGLLLPILFKQTRYWSTLFWPHVFIQALAALFVAAGLGLGAKLDLDGSEKHIHRGIGIAVFALILLQIIVALSARPKLHGKRRGIWNILHKWAGGTAVIVGIGNAYYGMNISLPATRYFAGYSAALGGWLLIAAIGQAFVYSSVGYEEAPLVQHSKRDQKPAIATTQA